MLNNGTNNVQLSSVNAAPWTSGAQWTVNFCCAFSINFGGVPTVFCGFKNKSQTLLIVSPPCFLVYAVFARFDRGFFTWPRLLRLASWGVSWDIFEKAHSHPLLDWHENVHLLYYVLHLRQRVEGWHQ